MKTQLGELKAIVGANNPDLAGKIQGLSDSLDLSKTVQNLSEKVATDLKSIKTEIEALAASKVGTDFISKFICLLQALKKAKEVESKNGKIISQKEWAQIVKSQFDKVAK